MAKKKLTLWDVKHSPLHHNLQRMVVMVWCLPLALLGAPLWGTWSKEQRISLAAVCLFVPVAPLRRVGSQCWCLVVMLTCDPCLRPPLLFVGTLGFGPSVSTLPSERDPLSRMIDNA